MKKQMFKFLIVGLVITAISFGSFAIEQNEYEKIGSSLQSLGFVQGDGGDLMYNSKIRRQDAIIILVRMLGLDSKVQEINLSKQSFNDIELNNYSAKYIEYAKNNGLTNGISADVFGLNQNLNQKQMITLMLRALKYEVDWEKDDIVALAKKAGIIEHLKIELDSNILRKDVFLLMRNTLISRIKDSEVRLVDELQKSGVLKSDSEKFVSALENLSEHKHSHNEAHEHNHDDLKVTWKALEDMGVSHGLVHAMVHSRSKIKFPKSETNLDELKKYMASITVLSVDKKNTEADNPFKLDGYQYLTGLKAIRVWPKKDKDENEILTYLTDEQVQEAFKKYPNLANVESLDFEKNGLKSINFVKDMKNLKRLYLFDNEVIDITPLKDKVALERFYAPNNKISSISVLSNLKKLSLLNLSGNKIKDVSALKGLPLMYANLNSNDIVDVSFIDSDKTEYLYLNSNKNLDVKTISAPNIETLLINDVGLKSLDDLKELKEVLTLRAGKNELVNLKGLSKFKKLENLHISENKIESFNIDNQNTGLLNLDVSNNNIRDWNGVDKFVNLVNVKIDGNKGLAPNPKYYSEILKNSHLGKFVNEEGRIYVIHNDHDHLESLKDYLKKTEVDFTVDNSEIIGINENSYYVNHLIKNGYYNVFEIKGRPIGMYRFPIYTRPVNKEIIKIDDKLAIKLNEELILYLKNTISKLNSEKMKKEMLEKLSKIVAEKDSYKLNDELNKLYKTIK